MKLTSTNNTKQNTNNNKNNNIIIYIYTFGKEINRENNRKSYFPITRGFALDNGGHMNSARQ